MTSFSSIAKPNISNKNEGAKKQDQIKPTSPERPDYYRTKATNPTKERVNNSFKPQYIYYEFKQV